MNKNQIKAYKIKQCNKETFQDEEDNENVINIIIKYRGEYKYYKKEEEQQQKEF